MPLMAFLRSDNVTPLTRRALRAVSAAHYGASGAAYTPLQMALTTVLLISSRAN